MTLNQLTPGQKAQIKGLDPNYAGANRLAQMGIVPGETVLFLGKAPLGDPLRIQIMNYELCLRVSDASAIEIAPAGAES